MRQQSRWSIGLTVSALTLMGCTHANTTPARALADAGTRREAVCPAAVELYTGTSRLRGVVEPVALLNYTEEARLVNEPMVMNALRRKAGQMGANAVILPTTTRLDEETRMLATMFGASTEPLNRSLAIYIPEDSARVRVTCNGDRS